MSRLSALLKSLRGNNSLRSAAQKAGISHNYLRMLELGKDPKTGAPIQPSPDVLKNLAQAYDFPYEKLLEAAGYMDNHESNEILELERIIENSNQQLTFYEASLPPEKREHFSEKRKRLNELIRLVLMDELDNKKK
ncbi:MULTISPECIES: helix-turn-helix domain-containing protein [Paenibacillus]|uniref:helix-turn-helix domain-containing protein n=1 Tax=Paenibacillus TaxID=44249 RepID=UPI00117FDBE7|nr:MULTISPECIES: helix-turn-helix transcriptional regulator [Paenibacillus]